MSKNDRFRHAPAILLRCLGASGVLLLALLPTAAADATAAIALAPSVDGVPTLAPLLDRVTPAVVNIAVRARSDSERSPLLRDPFFRRFFDLPPRGPARPQLSAGSGVIVDAERGYVLTNSHVVDDAAAIEVTLKDRRRFSAELIGRDPATDIALLRIDADDLTAIALGDSEALRVGDFVLAIGNPFGLGQTVTSGIVSALGRSGLNLEGYEDFIQTDASINPGNSGGALINLRGELVGINTAIIGNAGNIGIGFAVPTRMASAVMQQLIEHGEVRHGRLGLTLQDLTPELALALGIDDVVDGAVVGAVIPGTAAVAAGLRRGDVIIALDGRPVRGASDLINRVALSTIGSAIRLDVVRDGERRRIATVVDGADSITLRGEALRPELAGAVLETQPRGVVVTELYPRSPAAAHGLRVGDRIAAVNGAPVDSVTALRGRMRSARGALRIVIDRRGRELLWVLE